MLDLKNIRKTFNAKTVNEKVALDGLNLHLDDGDFVTVIGGNGAGKSTMLNAIAGVWPVDSGSIVIDGTEVTGLPEHKRAALLGRVFQDPMTGTAATMQIEENLALAARRGDKRTLKIGITKEEREEYYEKLAALGLGLEGRMTTKVGLLSGGQRQALTLLMATLKKFGKDASPAFYVATREWLTALDGLWTEENLETLKRRERSRKERYGRQQKGNGETGRQS